jgi:predicted thioesterase
MENGAAYLDDDVGGVALEVELGHAALRVGDHLPAEAAVRAVEDVRAPFLSCKQISIEL